MTTLRRFASGSLAIPASTAWYLADLGEFLGLQTLYTRQSPQRLKALREHALIESAVSSNRIEGVMIEPARVRDILVAPKPLFRDRDEEEVRGYRDALELVHHEAASLPMTDATVQGLHGMTRGQIWDAGKYKEKDGDIIERYADGSERIRFRTVPAKQTPQAMQSLMLGWHEGANDPWPYANFVLSILKTAYRDLVERVGDMSAPRGAKTDLVLAAIARLAGEFTVSQLEQECPGVSRDMVRRILRARQAAGVIECQGRGPAARWLKKG